MKVLSVSGYSKSGKTSTVTSVIRVLKKRGFRVAAIKDIHFEDFSMEKEGSDSWQFQKAGADTVFARGLKETYLIKPEQMLFPDMLGLIDADWVIVEGMKSEPLPKIICAENEQQLSELVDDNVFAVCGKISNHCGSYKDIPVINSLKHPEKIVDLIEQKVFEVLPAAKEECCSRCGMSCYQMEGEILAGRKKRDDCQTDRNKSIVLKIDGKEITIVPFVQNILRDIITAFVSNLHGYKKGKIEISLE